MVGIYLGTRLDENGKVASRASARVEEWLDGCKCAESGQRE